MMSQRMARAATEAVHGPPAHQYLLVGQIVAPRGLRGELKVRVETEDAAHWELAHVYVGPEQVRYAVANARPFGAFLLLMLQGIGSREDAESLRGQMVYADQDALPLGEDEYYHYQIEGLAVYSEDGTLLGRVAEILETGANDVYVVAGPRGELLLPAIKDVIRQIDVPGGTMTVRVPEGLVD